MWRGKPVLMSKHASEEMLNENMALGKVLQTLEEGLPSNQRRREGVLELVKGFKKDAYKVVVAEKPENWVIITVMRFRR